MAGNLCKRILRNGQFFQQSTQCFAATEQKRYSSTTLDLSGIYPPIATPFKDNEDINWEALNSNLKKWDELPFRGLFINYFTVSICPAVFFTRQFTAQIRKG